MEHARNTRKLLARAGGKEARRLTDARVLASHFAAMQVEYSAVSGAQREPDEEAAARWHGVVAVAGGAASSASAGGAAAGPVASSKEKSIFQGVCLFLVFSTLFLACSSLCRR